MRIKKNFEIQDVCGVSMVIPSGMENIDFDCIVHLNETGAFLWREAEKGEFSIDSLCESLLAEYDVGIEVAHSDVEAFVEKLKIHSLVED